MNTEPLGWVMHNLGTLLMVSGIPYDSEEARAVAGASYGDHDRYFIQNIS